MAKHIPGYLEKAVVESGDTQAEVLLSLVEATEEQTEKLERIAVALEVLGGLSEEGIVPALKEIARYTGRTGVV